MKIAVIGSRGYPYVYSGYETFVSELAPRLVEKGMEVHVYCHRKLFKNKPRELNGIRLHYIPAIELKSFSQLSHSFLSTMHALFKRYDVILFVNSANGIFGMFTRLFGIKTAINVDGLEWKRPKWKGAGAKVFYFCSKMATKWMDVIITDAEEMRKVYLAEFKKDSEVIAYGATIRYSQNPSLISKWGLEKDGYYLIVGRLIPDNNAALIIGEFVQSKSVKKLVVVGDVPYKDKYASDIKNIKDERVIFTGYVNDKNELSELYHNCYAYFHGHEFGGTNPTLLKALAYGCAIMALDTVFNREVLKEGEYGLFFTKDKNSIVDLIGYLEKDSGKIQNLREIARNRIKEKYTWEQIIDKYESLFLQLIKKAS